MYIYWLEQRAEDVPPMDDWLSAGETVILNGLQFAKRRADWRLGRWTAKHAVASFLNLPAHPQALANIEIRPAPSGAPEAFVANAPAPVSISLSHRDGTALCAIASSRAGLEVDLGCDLEIIEPRSEAFVADYFAPEEQALMARSSPADRPRISALLWSAKESALKALREGLRLDTRSVVASLFVDSFDSDSCDLNRWNPLHIRCADGLVFRGWWQMTNSVVRTVVANPCPRSPILLNVPACFSGHAPFPIPSRREKIKAAVSMVHGSGNFYAPSQ